MSFFSGRGPKIILMAIALMLVSSLLWMMYMSTRVADIHHP